VPFVHIWSSEGWSSEGTWQRPRFEEVEAVDCAVVEMVRRAVEAARRVVRRIFAEACRH
jgi:2-oxo-4-hydroxy-4-carboxy--5-ureidoimidazoline (OHCU) decarboxylase